MDTSNPQHSSSFYGIQFLLYLFIFFEPGVKPYALSLQSQGTDSTEMVVSYTTTVRIGELNSLCMAVEL